MSKPLVGVVVGSRADFNIMRRGLESLRVMGVPYVFEMASAHRTPERLMKFAQSAADNGLEVLICAAGGSAQIAGMIASYTTLPVIAVPIDSTPLRGEDALHSMIQQPPGTPVATVGINNGENAALLATQILAIKFPHYRTVLTHQRQAMVQKLDSAAKELLSEYPDLCDPKKTAPSYLKPAAIDDDTDSNEQDTHGDGEAEHDTSEDDTGRIRPGASLEFRVNAPPSRAGALVSTPVPQEPGRSTVADTRSRDAVGVPSREEIDFPPPPKDSDLTPLPLFAETITPPAVKPPPKDETEVKTDEILANLERVLKETKVFQLENTEDDEDVFSHAMMVLLEGGIVAFPTDTVYGLAADATNPDAVRTLYEIKGQEPQRKSLSILIHTPDLLDNLVKEVPAAVESVMERLWPGALSILFFKQPSVLATVSDVPSIAIRIPNDKTALRVLELVRRPLVVINAAIQDSTAATDAREVLDRFDCKIDCILDAGPCPDGQTSTVLSVLTDPFEILREGAVLRDDLKKILGDRLKD
jgi:5-(carboxyamino)imidazole ribonucleotide mutase